MPASRAMRVQVLEHVSFEGVGSIEGWLRARGADVRYTRFHEAEHALPDARGLDLVIAMGGPMSVNDEATLPWLKAEKQFLRDAIGAGVAVLGVCLGAQLVASALGARVQRNARKEIGWFDVRATPAPDAFRFPDRLLAFHWHGETFELPPGARRLASSDACLNQAFQLGTNVVGVQFHLETTPQSLDAMIGADRRELVEAAFVQSEAALRAVPASAYRRINEVMVELLDYLTRREPRAAGEAPARAA